MGMAAPVLLGRVATLGAMRRVALVTGVLVLGALDSACVSESMWQRQIRRVSVSLAVGDRVSAREEAEVAMSLARVSLGGPGRVAATFEVAASVEIRDERWLLAECNLRRAIALRRAADSTSRVENGLFRLRGVLVEQGRLDEARVVEDELLESLVRPRSAPAWNGRRWGTKTWTEKEARGGIEWSFAGELVEAGAMEAALDAFRRGESLSPRLRLVSARNAEHLLLRAVALEDVGREEEAAALREEVREVLGRSDYVGDVLLDAGDYSIVARWQHSDMPLRIYIERPSTLVVERPDVAFGIAHEAVEAWQDTAGGGVPRFVFLREAKDADIRIAWFHDRRFEGTVGLCTSNAEWQDEPMQGARVTLYSRILGKYLPEDRLRHVAIHEVGHALGLHGHSPLEDDTMYPSVPATPLAEPSARDRQTLRRLYSQTPGQSYNP
jgi:predicted Zn-dependent protease